MASFYRLSSRQLGTQFDVVSLAKNKHNIQSKWKKWSESHGVNRSWLTLSNSIFSSFNILSQSWIKEFHENKIKPAKNKKTKKQEKTIHSMCYRVQTESNWNQFVYFKDFFYSNYFLLCDFQSRFSQFKPLTLTVSLFLSSDSQSESSLCFFEESCTNSHIRFHITESENMQERKVLLHSPYPKEYRL